MRFAITINPCHSIMIRSTTATSSYHRHGDRRAPSVVSKKKSPMTCSPMNDSSLMNSTRSNSSNSSTSEDDTATKGGASSSRAVPPSPPLKVSKKKKQNLKASPLQYNFVGRDFAPIHTEDMSKKVVQCAQKRLGRQLLPNSTTSVPTVCNSQIQLGKSIGEGSFHTVYQVQHLKPSARRVLSSADDESSCADGVVVKLLRRRLLDKPQRFAQAAADLVKEAKFLAMLKHPNIVKVQAWTTGELCAFYNGRHDAFGILLEELSDVTLRTKLTHEWPRRQKQLAASKRWRLLFRGTTTRQQGEDLQRAFVQERLQVVTDLASALQHLQDHHILHRDIKPENVGFNKAGVVKLLDFDVARRLPTTVGQAIAAGNVLERGSSSNSSSDNNTVTTFQDYSYENNDNPNRRIDPQTLLFYLTQKVGSKRYQAPEVGRGEAYNLKADVYSLGILTWEVLTLRKPFDGWTSQQHSHYVFVQGQRPSLHNLSKPLARFLESCWTNTVKERYTMARAQRRWASLVNEGILLQEKTSFSSSSSSSKSVSSTRSMPASNTTVATSTRSSITSTSASARKAKSTKKAAAPMAASANMNPQQFHWTNFRYN